MSSVHRWGWGRTQTLPLLGGRSNPNLALLPEGGVAVRSRAENGPPGIRQAWTLCCPAVLTLVWGTHSQVALQWPLLLVGVEGIAGRRVA